MLAGFPTPAIWSGISKNVTLTDVSLGETSRKSLLKFTLPAMHLNLTFDYYFVMLRLIGWCWFVRPAAIGCCCNTSHSSDGLHYYNVSTTTSLSLPGISSISSLSTTLITSEIHYEPDMIWSCKIYWSQRWQENSTKAVINVVNISH